MKSILRRIEKLEKRLLPPPETPPSREWLKGLEEARQRVEAYRKAEGLPDPDEGLPPEKIHTSHGIRLIMDILHEGRDRARLRSIRDGTLHQSRPLAGSPDPACGSNSDTQTSPVTGPPMGHSPVGD